MSCGIDPPPKVTFNNLSVTCLMMVYCFKLLQSVVLFLEKVKLLMGPSHFSVQV